MPRYRIHENLTPGQRRARTTANAIDSALLKLKHESNKGPQFFEGTVSNSFAFRDGRILIQFQQFGQDYQVIIGPESGKVYDTAKALLPLYKNRTRFFVTVNAQKGFTNEKGICNLKQVTYIR